jgi:hypothetical protein
VGPPPKLWQPGCPELSAKVTWLQESPIGQEERNAITSCPGEVSQPSMATARILTPEGSWTGATKHGLELVVENLYQAES